MHETMQLPRNVIDAALHLIPDDLRAGLMAAGPQAAVAGGFLRTVCTQVFPSRYGPAENAPKDIDVFVSTEAAIDPVAWPLRKDFDWVRHDRSCTIHRCEVPIQVIGEWQFKEPGELIDLFDFSVIRAAMWWNGSEWQGVATGSWTRDVIYREANYFPEAPNPAGTLTRIARFAELGYRIPDWSLASIAVRATQQAEQYATQYYAHVEMEPADALQRLLESRISPHVVDFRGMWDGYD